MIVYAVYGVSDIGEHDELHKLFATETLAVCSVELSCATMPGKVKWTFDKSIRGYCPDGSEVVIKVHEVYHQPRVL